MIAASSKPVGLLGAVSTDRDTRTDAVGVPMDADIEIEDGQLPSTSTPRSAVTSTQFKQLRAGASVPTDVTAYASDRPASVTGPAPLTVEQLDVPDRSAVSHAKRFGRQAAPYTYYAGSIT